MFACVVSFIVWAYFAVLDEVIKGDGKVIPSSQVQVVQNLEGGIVKQINVAEGDVVAEGQLLLTIDDTRFDSSLQESRIRELSLRGKAIRLRAEAEGGDALPEFPDEIKAVLPDLHAQEQKLFDERQRELVANRQILGEQLAQKKQAIVELKVRSERLQRSLGLSQRELNVTRPLQSQGAVSAVEVLRLERQVNDLNGELEEARLSIPRAEAELAEVEQRRVELDAGFRKDARAELSEVNAELSSLAAGNVALADRVRRTQVRSPIRGVIKSLQVRTVGGVVQPGMDLIEIVPVGESLLVEARVKPRDIAFLSPGLSAKVKLTAYDFAIYGGLDAQVEHISADTFVDEKGEAYYLVRVRTQAPELQSEGKAYSIIPGMTAEVDILVGEKSVLSYILKPVLRARANALREP
ncbi:MAG: HlyD family type I secretion periplasmic adaptor subunit [Gammaproteobacteria bacterium]|nr:HlyD family type I secretion periplasmic adaptor subunit [Gammaproteobacteria bacterium]MCB1925787.1 HlyD family type I secretion periplasmic adaptor subunit [Gammaproteobacteria bacterium]